MKKDKTAAVVHEWIEKKNVKKEREKENKQRKETDKSNLHGKRLERYFLLLLFML